MAEPFSIARTGGGADIWFSPAVANRHGLITGATGTGKTVSLQVLADHFSAIGVPVFLADVKGDLTGLAAAGSLTPKMKERLAATGVAEPAWRADPVVLWDVFGKRGTPVREEQLAGKRRSRATPRPSPGRCPSAGGAWMRTA